jgi:hypothetical protein
MEGVHGQLELAMLGVCTFEGEDVRPIHSVGKEEVVEPAGTITPKVFGRTMGTAGDSENSLEPRSRSSDGLGRK